MSFILVKLELKTYMEYLVTFLENNLDTSVKYSYLVANKLLGFNDNENIKSSRKREHN